MKSKRMHLPPSALASTSKRPVSIRLVHASPGLTTVEMSVDYRGVDAPNRAYFADYCDVQKGRISYSLVFGKLEIGGSVLRTKIEVTFPRELFLRLLWGTSRGIHEILAKLPLQKLEPIKPNLNTDKVQTFRANNLFMGMWGEDAVLDFYYMSPKAMGELNLQPKVEADLEPIIRVAMDTALLYEFLEKCRPFVEERSEASSLVSVEVK
jgi:hypothetical protein